MKPEPTKFPWWVLVYCVIALLILIYLAIRDFRIDTFLSFFVMEFTGLLAIGTIILANQSKHGMTLTKEILELSRQEFIATHRPRIRIKHVWMNPGTGAGDKLSVRLVVVNTGDTPASFLVIKCRFYLANRPYGLPDRYLDIPPTLKLNEKLPSGATFDFKSIITDSVLTEVEVRCLYNDRCLLYCVGDIEYRDDLDAPRKTAFCRIWTNLPSNARLVRPENPEPDYEYED